MSLVEISNPIISPVIYDKQCCSGVCINICFLNKTFATEITVRLAISNDIDSDYICQEWVYHVSRASPICCTPTYPIIHIYLEKRIQFSNCTFIKKAAPTLN